MFPHTCAPLRWGKWYPNAQPSHVCLLFLAQADKCKERLRRRKKNPPPHTHTCQSQSLLSRPPPLPFRPLRDSDRWGRRICVKLVQGGKRVPSRSQRWTDPGLFSMAAHTRHINPLNVICAKVPASNITRQQNVHFHFYNKRVSLGTRMKPWQDEWQTVFKVHSTLIADSIGNYWTGLFLVHE